ncbi:MAG: GNAT family N-acetyltransferase [Dehalococcoidia bacterium]|nr:GNAT family N-acetyltransferase [Dehalococcoidia bacterium]
MRRSTIFEFLNRPPTILPGKKVRLRSRKIEDCANEFRWRTDDELCRLDTSVPVTFSYAEFLDRYSVALSYPGLTYTLAVDSLEGMHIGNCSLFNVDFVDGSTEIGILIGEKSYWNQGYGSDAVATFIQHIFDSSDIEKIFLRTLDWNMRAQNCFEKCGFVSHGTLIKGDYSFRIMERHRPLKPDNAQ